MGVVFIQEMGVALFQAMSAMKNFQVTGWVTMTILCCIRSYHTKSQQDLLNPSEAIRKKAPLHFGVQ